MSGSRLGEAAPPLELHLAGWGFSIGLQTDGTLWGWGEAVRRTPFFAGMDLR